jgi:MFS family permease
VSLEQRHVRRNLIFLTGDFVSFSIGLAFFDPLVIVPAFVQALGGPELVIGALAAVRTIMVTLPQILAATLLAALPRKKPLLIWSSVGGRLPVLALALATFWAGQQHPGWVLLILGLAVLLFFTSEGLNSISWPDMVGKVLPAGIRGRFLGVGQLLSSGGALLAGYAMRRILLSESLIFPNNWGLIFACAFAGLIGSVVFIGMIREAPGATVTLIVDVRKHIGLLAGYLRSDARLRRVVLVQLLLYSASAVFPFIVIRAQELILDGNEILGGLVIAQNLGGMVAALACGYLVDRVGSYAAIRIGAIAECVALGLVLLAPLVSHPYLVYLAAFFPLGLFTGSSWWVFTTYLMDIATEEQRASYLAASGILTSPSFVVSLLVGALFTSARAEGIFGAGLLCALLALALSLTLDRMRAGRPVTP